MSPLLSLPAELRLLIYEEYFRAVTERFYQAYVPRNASREQYKVGDMPDLWTNTPPYYPFTKDGTLQNLVRPLLVCHQMCNEMKPLLVKLNAAYMDRLDQGLKGLEEEQEQVSNAVWKATPTLAGLPAANDAFRVLGAWRNDVEVRHETVGMESRQIGRFKERLTRGLLRSAHKQ